MTKKLSVFINVVIMFSSGVDTCEMMLPESQHDFFLWTKCIFRKIQKIFYEAMLSL